MMVAQCVMALWATGGKCREECADIEEVEDAVLVHVGCAWFGWLGWIVEQEPVPTLELTGSPFNNDGGTRSRAIWARRNQPKHLAVCPLGDQDRPIGIELHPDWTDEPKCTGVDEETHASKLLKLPG